MGVSVESYNLWWKEFLRLFGANFHAPAFGHAKSEILEFAVKDVALLQGGLYITMPVAEALSAEQRQVVIEEQCQRFAGIPGVPVVPRA